MTRPPRDERSVTRTAIQTSVLLVLLSGNQDLTTSNHTPAWDTFKIPHVD